MNDTNNQLTRLALQTGDLVALLADNGSYLGVVSREGRTPIEATKTAFEPSCQLKATAFSDGQVALQSSGGEYLSVIERTVGGQTIRCVEALKNEPDQSCKFRVENMSDGAIRLSESEGDRCWSVINGALQTVPAGEATQNGRAQFIIVPLYVNLLLKRPLVGDGSSRADRSNIAFMAPGPSFLRRVDDGTSQSIEASGTLIDSSAQFDCRILPDGKINLRASNGLDLCQVARNGINSIEATGNADTSFTPTILPNGQVALRTDGGEYLSMILRSRYGLEAAKDRIDPFSVFTLIPTYLKLGFEPGDVIALQASNGKFLSCSTGEAGDWKPVLAVKDCPDGDCVFTIVHSHFNQPYPEGAVALRAADGNYLCLIETVISEQGGTDITSLRLGKIAAGRNGVASPFFFKHLGGVQFTIHPVLGSYQPGSAEGLAVLGRGAAAAGFPDLNQVDVMFAAADNSDIKFSVYQIFSNRLARQAFRTGDVIVLRASKYLSLISRDNALGLGLESVADSIGPYCEFEVTTFQNEAGKIALKGDGKYLSRVTHNGREAIESAKDTIDESCKFMVRAFDDGRLALQADNGKYLSVINRGGDWNGIEATKDAVDVFCQFTALWKAPVRAFDAEYRRQIEAKYLQQAEPAFAVAQGMMKGVLDFRDGTILEVSGEGTQRQTPRVNLSAPGFAPSIIYNPARERLESFWCDPPGAVWQSRKGAGPWSSPFLICGPPFHALPPVRLLYDPARNSVDAFFRDVDLALWHSFHDGQKRQLVRIADGPVPLPPAPVYDVERGHKHVFWFAENGALKDTYWNGSTWQTEQVTAGKLYTAPGATYNPIEKRAEVFWFDRDSNLRNSWREGASWVTNVIPRQYPPEGNPFIEVEAPLPGMPPMQIQNPNYQPRQAPPNSYHAPAPLYDADGRKRIFWRALEVRHGGIRRDLHNTYWDGSQWRTEIVSVAGDYGDSPHDDSIVVPHDGLEPGRVDFCWREKDELWKTWGREGAWQTAKVN